jgi:hypothetical protein
MKTTFYFLSVISSPYMPRSSSLWIISELSREPRVLPSLNPASLCQTEKDHLKSSQKEGLQTNRKGGGGCPGNIWLVAALHAPTPAPPFPPPRHGACNTGQETYKCTLIHKKSLWGPTFTHVCLSSLLLLENKYSKRWRNSRGGDLCSVQVRRAGRD